MSNASLRRHPRRPAGRGWPPAMLAAALMLAIGCHPAARSTDSATYVPRTRAIAVTTVPLLVREAQVVYPFLKPDFATGAVLDGKEVYGFSPSTLTVVPRHLPMMSGQLVVLAPSAIAAPPASPVPGHSQ